MADQEPGAGMEFLPEGQEPAGEFEIDIQELSPALLQAILEGKSLVLRWDLSKSEEEQIRDIIQYAAEIGIPITAADAKKIISSPFVVAPSNNNNE